MQNEEITFSFTSKQFNELFPFHIRFDFNLIIRGFGGALQNIFNLEINQSLLGFFSVVNEEYKTLNVHDLSSNPYLVIQNHNASLSHLIILKGKIVKLSTTRELVFVGSPLFTNGSKDDEMNFNGDLSTSEVFAEVTDKRSHPNFPLKFSGFDSIKGTAITDSLGAIEWVSNDFEQSLGYSLSEIRGKRPRDVIYGKDSIFIDPTYVDQKVREKRLFSFDNVGLNKYGRSFWFRTTILPLLEPNGEIKGRFYHFEDISKLKISEDSLSKKESELNGYQALLHTLIENFDSAIIFENLDREILVINKSLLRLTSLDISREDLSGHKTSDSLQKIKKIFKHPNKEIDRINEIIAAGKPVNFRIVHLKDGRVLKQQFFPISDSINELGYLWIYNDITNSYYANKKLLQQKKYFYRILNEIPSDIVILNIKKEFVFINKAAVKDSKMRKWLIGKTMFDYCGKRKIDQALAEERNAYFDEVMKFKTIKSVIDSYLLYDNTEKHVLRYIYPFTDKKSEVEFMVVYGTDITQQKLYEKELQKVKAYYENILNDLPIEIVRFNINNEYEFINKKVEPDHAIRQWLTTKNDYEYCQYKGWDISVAEKRHKLFDQAISSATKVSDVIEYVNNEGIRSYVFTTLSAFVGKNGITSHVLGYGIDITDLFESKKNAEDKETHLSRLMDVTSEGIFTCDKYGALSYYNTPFLDLLDCTDKIIKYNENVSNLFLKTNASIGAEYFRQITSEGQISKLSLKLVNDLGYTRHLELRVARLNASVDTGYVCSVHDISDTVYKEQKLNDIIRQEQSLNYSKSQFIRITSHELRTPLAIILANSELLEMLNDPEFYNVNAIRPSDLIKRIVREVSLMEEMLNELMMVSKIESGKVDIKYESILLDDFINAIANELYLPYNDGRNLQIISKNTQGLIVVMDRKLIRHALVNLINNAFKYSKQKRAPILYLILDKNNIVIKIQDFGIGIPEKDKPNLFNTFFRASNVGAIQGTGVGLMVVEYVTKLHKGILNLESTENNGSIFTLTIPLNLTDS